MHTISILYTITASSQGIASKGKDVLYNKRLGYSVLIRVAYFYFLRISLFGYTSGALALAKSSYCSYFVKNGRIVTVKRDESFGLINTENDLRVKVELSIRYAG